MSSMTPTTLEERLNGLRSRLFTTLLDKEMFQEKVNAADLEIKALRNIIAGIELALEKPAT